MNNSGIEVIDWKKGAQIELFNGLKVCDLISILKNFNQDSPVCVFWEGQQKKLHEYNIFENKDSEIIINADSSYSPCELGARNRTREK